MRRIPVVLISLTLLAAACGDGESAGPTSTTSPSVTPTSLTPSTTAAPPTTASTTTAHPTTTGPAHYRYGEDGLFRIVDGVEMQLDAEPVREAHDDLLGGVLYRYGWEVERPGTFWLQNGATEPVRVEPSYDFYFTAVYDGRPSLFFPALNPAGADATDESCLIVRDLVTGSETALLCGVGVAGQDGGWSVRSFGGGRFAAISWMAVGGMGSDRRIGFWDSTGERIDLKANPVPETCEPCTLSAHLSDDGSLLAYSSWPTAFWTDSTSSSGIESDYESWKSTAEGIPTVLAVVDLTTGNQLWTRSAEPWSRIVDFDGRYVVVEQGQRDDQLKATIHDTWAFQLSITVPGSVTLSRSAARR